MRIPSPLCLFNRHAPHRNRVKWDGLNFVGTCRHCGKPIRRKAHGGWRSDWHLSTAEKPLFLPKPSEDQSHTNF
ncbi:MAG TPA: hypothetical protein VN222_08385 [Novosphingobium sp.]|nr:hypothetical protein [Novosphingobium sp.]